MARLASGQERGWCAMTDADTAVILLGIVLGALLGMALAIALGVI